MQASIFENKFSLKSLLNHFSLLTRGLDFLVFCCSWRRLVSRNTWWSRLTLPVRRMRTWLLTSCFLSPPTTRRFSYIAEWFGWDVLPNIYIELSWKLWRFFHNVTDHLTGNLPDCNHCACFSNLTMFFFHRLCKIKLSILSWSLASVYHFALSFRSS